jgi:hypothetical protein
VSILTWEVAVLLKRIFLNFFCLSCPAIHIAHDIYLSENNTDTCDMQNQLGLIPGSTSGGYNNGQIVCRFNRLIDALSQQGRRRRRQSTDAVFPLNSNVYYILIAQGRASAGKGHSLFQRYFPPSLVYRDLYRLYLVRNIKRECLQIG